MPSQLIIKMDQLKSSIYFSLATAPFDLIFWHKNRHFPRPAESDPNAWAHLETIELAYHSVVLQQTNIWRACSASSPVRESHTFDTAWCLLKQSSIVSMVMLVVALLVVLPAVFAGIVNVGEYLETQRLSAVSNNQQLAGVSIPLFLLPFAEGAFPIISINSVFHEKDPLESTESTRTGWNSTRISNLETWSSTRNSTRNSTRISNLETWHGPAWSSYWRVEATAVSSVTTNLQVGSSRVLEPNKPNDKLKPLLNWI